MTSSRSARSRGMQPSIRSPASTRSAICDRGGRLRRGSRGAAVHSRGRNLRAGGTRRDRPRCTLGGGGRVPDRLDGLKSDIPARTSNGLCSATRCARSSPASPGVPVTAARRCRARTCARRVDRHRRARRTWRTFSSSAPYQGRAGHRRPRPIDGSPVATVVRDGVRPRFGHLRRRIRLRPRTLTNPPAGSGSHRQSREGRSQRARSLDSALRPGRAGRCSAHSAPDFLAARADDDSPAHWRPLRTGALRLRRRQ